MREMEPSNLNNTIINPAPTNTTVVSTESISTVQNQTPPVNSVPNSGSWPLVGMWVGSSFSVVGGFLIVWQNLKRMGEASVAKKFILLSFLLIPLIFLLAGVIGIKNIPWGILPSLWLWHRYFGKDSKRLITEPKPLFRWEIIKWGLLGVLIELPLFIITFVLSK